MNIKNYVNDFKDGIRFEFKKCKNLKFDPHNPDLFEAAVKEGYGDAKRTFTKIGEFWQKKPELKEKLFKSLAEKIRTLFLCTDIEFNSWHKETCKYFCNELNENGYEAAYGQAQKIVNMALKYLYCLDGAEQYEYIFKKCHMPLDSFTLEWFKRTINTKSDENEKIKSETWSKMSEETYDKVCSKIFKELSDQNVLPQNPLMAEFIIWPEIQLNLATEAFYFALNNISEKSEKDKFKKLSINEKLKIVSQNIKKHNTNADL